MSAENEVTTSEPLILELLRQKGAVKTSDWPKVLDTQAKHSVTLEEAMVRAGVVDEKTIAHAYAEHQMLPLWSLEQGRSKLDALAGLELLPEKMCRDHLCVPVDRVGSTLSVAAVNPTDVDLFEGMQLAANMHIDVLVGSLSDVASATNTLFGARDVARELAAEIGSETQDDSDELADSVLDLGKPVPKTQEGQVVSLVNHILEQAVQRRASDIHLEPYEDSVRSRLRIDGSLVELTPPPRVMFIPMISRLKILSRMDISEKRIPQDGAFSIQSDGKKIDLRVSTIPSVWGEKMVLRLLNKSAIPLEMSRLGFSDKQSKDFDEAIHSPHGLIFVTGPTGSGKSTTLYTALNMLNTPDTNIVTVEDPVEYRFTGINQIQVRAHVGLTFASALRSFLRQDPDIMMVGEVRDQETAEICMRSALTGHLVLSTLHTNDALSAINRLADMQIQPFLLSATLRLVQAQRLIRRLCTACKKPQEVDDKTVAALGIKKDAQVFGPVGCDACGGSGYKGRVGIFEVIRIGSRIRNLIQKRATWQELHDAAVAEGFEFLVHSGVRQVLMGTTSIEEVMGVALAGDD